MPPVSSVTVKLASLASPGALSAICFQSSRYSPSVLYWYSWRVTPEPDAGTSQVSATCNSPAVALKLVGASGPGRATPESFFTAGTPSSPVVKETASSPSLSWMAAASSPEVGSV